MLEIETDDRLCASRGCVYRAVRSRGHCAEHLDVMLPGWRVEYAEQAVLEAARALTMVQAGWPWQPTSTWEGRGERNLWHAIWALREADRKAAGEVE